MHTLYTGQLIDLARDRVEGADELIAVIQQTQAKLADLVADHYEVRHGTTNFDMDEMGSSFGPKQQGQECPAALGELDEGSDWVNEPEDQEPLKPMVVIYTSVDVKGAPAPEAFRCCAVDSDQAETLCEAYFGKPVDILWVVETDSVTVALDSYWRADEPRPEVARRMPSSPTMNDVCSYPVTILDQEQGYDRAEGTVTALPHGVSVRVQGYTDFASVDDMGELINLIRYKGELQLLVFANVNQEEPTHTISLEGARNLSREILHPV